jgi:hypothetical protein
MNADAYISRKGPVEQEKREERICDLIDESEISAEEKAT